METTKTYPQTYIEDKVAARIYLKLFFNTEGPAQNLSLDIQYKEQLKKLGYAFDPIFDNDGAPMIPWQSKEFDWFKFSEYEEDYEQIYQEYKEEHENTPELLTDDAHDAELRRLYGLAENMEENKELQPNPEDIYEPWLEEEEDGELIRSSGTVPMKEIQKNPLLKAFWEELGIEKMTLILEDKTELYYTKIRKPGQEIKYED